MSSVNRFRLKPIRSVEHRRVPGTLGDCPDCGRPMREDRYHDCGEQLEIPLPRKRKPRRAK